MAFLAMNSRLRAVQLPAAAVSYSRNARMRDGVWVPRKGKRSLSGGMNLTKAPLVLPFNLHPAHPAVVAASRSAGIVTLIFASAHEIAEETIIYVSGIGYSDQDPNGNHAVTAAGVDHLSYASAGADEIFNVAAALVETGPLLAEVYDDRIFAAAEYSDPWDSETEYLILATAESLKAMHAQTGEWLTIHYGDNQSVDERASILQVDNRILIFRSNKPALQLAIDQPLSEMSGPFSVVTSGEHPGFPELTDEGATIDAAGVAHMYLPAHGLNSGQDVVILKGVSAGLQDGAIYPIKKVDDDTIEISTDVLGTENTSLITIRRKSAAGGYERMPVADWGVYHQNRLWLPRGRNEIIASDLLDIDTYDRVINQFTFGAGTSDYLVGLCPWQEDGLLVLCRRSVHLIIGVRNDLASAQVVEITREIGCVSRKSIIPVGNTIYWLSDNGIQSIEFGDELKLRGTVLPLSHPISDVLDSVDYQLAEQRALAAYMDNNLYFAVPIRSEIASDAGINALLIYDLINNAWASIDLFDGDYDILALVSALRDARQRLFLVTPVGGVDLHEDIDNGNDQYGSPNNDAIMEIPTGAGMTSRQYGYPMFERSRLQRIEMQLKAGDGGAHVKIFLITEDPDYEIQIAELAIRPDEDLTFRQRVTASASLYQIRVSVESGRCRVRSLRLKGTGYDQRPSTRR